MAKIEDLIKNVPDEQLRDEIAREVAKLKAGKKFGLVFEEHLPENVQIPSLPVRPGARVVRRGGNNNRVYKVLSSASESEVVIALEPNGPQNGTEEVVPIEELVVIKKFGEPIYPSLTPVDRITRAPGKPYHTLINADNFHALQLLTYTHAGQVDVIYIDPPYNTGARDWKYNNDYVDSTDQYRHSKWLSMMKKRLILAKTLLRWDGVLIITIDDNELNNLGALLKDLFPSAAIHIIVIEHNKRGRPQGNFAPTHEYAYFVIPSNQTVIAEQIAPRDIRSINLRRTGNNSARSNRKSMFYPIYVEPISLRIAKIGDVPNDDFHPSERAALKDNLVEIWPLDDQGIEKCWYFGREGLMDLIQSESGRIQVFRHKGDIRLAFASDNEGRTTYKTVWSDSKYDASYYGSTLVKNILGQDFPFPKSLYAVHECLTAVCRHRRDAVILDFFTGSGTTLHAATLLNSEDGGKRRCILVTNNEVGENQAKILNQQGLWPGHPDFEQHGISESITWPRCKYVTVGQRANGEPLAGKYLNGKLMSEGFEENLEYFKLDFLDPDEVAYGEHFEAILPILWLMAGAHGEREDAEITDQWFIPAYSPFAVLLDETAYMAFRRKIRERADITHIFLVTDSEPAYREMIAGLPEHIQTRMLYKSYLDNFRINTEKNL